MKDSIFYDTNIFIYVLDSRDLRKQKIAKELIRLGLQNNNVHTSTQVVQESINVMTKKYKDFSYQDIHDYLKFALFPFLTIYPSKDLYAKALELHYRWRFSFYDSLIVASAIESRSNILYSEDLKDGQIIEGLKIVNPF